jgi:hypothetical protein
MVRDADQLGDIEMVGDGWQLRSAISEVHHRYVEKFGRRSLS